MDTFDLFVDQIRREVKSLGAEELKTPEEVDSAVKAKGTTLIFVNSMCGCAGGIARPALQRVLTENVKPDHLATVFAGQDLEATARARSYFGTEPPSSPSFALMKDGRFLGIIHRKDIEGREPAMVAETLKNFLEAYT